MRKTLSSIELWSMRVVSPKGLAYSSGIPALRSPAK